MGTRALGEPAVEPNPNLTPSLIMRRNPNLIPNLTPNLVGSPNRAASHPLPLPKVFVSLSSFSNLFSNLRAVAVFDLDLVRLALLVGAESRIHSSLWQLIS